MEVRYPEVFDFSLYQGFPLLGGDNMLRFAELFEIQVDRQFPDHVEQSSNIRGVEIGPGLLGDNFRGDGNCNTLVRVLRSGNAINRQSLVERIVGNNDAQHFVNLVEPNSGNGLFYIIELNRAAVIGAIRYPKNMSRERRIHLYEGCDVIQPGIFVLDELRQSQKKYWAMLVVAKKTPAKWVLQLGCLGRACL